METIEQLITDLSRRGYRVALETVPAGYLLKLLDPVANRECSFGFASAEAERMAARITAQYCGGEDEGSQWLLDPLPV
jgi:hypothetical protein